MPAKKKARTKRKQQANSWIAFLRECKGQNLSQQAKRKLYVQQQRQTQLIHVSSLPKRPHPSVLIHAAPTDVIVAAPGCVLTHDMSIKDICRFIARTTPLGRIGFKIVGVVGSGSYGLVLDIVDLQGISYVMKVSRICEERAIPIRLPIMNNQKTSWHSITFRDFKRGVRAQQKMCSIFKNLRIPRILHAGCIRLCDEERLGMIIMQKINGVTLRKVLQTPSISDETKRILVRKAGKIGAQLHRAGVIHGDFHVWNILCDSSGHLYLIDFDRTSLSTHSAHRMHDLGMQLDTMDEQYWPTFTESYFNLPNMKLPFVLHSDTKEERKKELHEQSRNLFGVYLSHLKEHEKTLAI